MSQELDNLRVAFMKYVDSISQQESMNQCSMSEKDRKQVFQDFVAGNSTHSSVKNIMVIPITEPRAIKLKSNLISTFGVDSLFNKDVELPLEFVKLIRTYFQKYSPLENVGKPNPSKEIVFELVSFSTNSLDFAIIFPNGQKYLLLDINSTVEISEEVYKKAKIKFEAGIGVDYDKSFKGNIFSKNQINTRKIFIEYGGKFEEFCKSVLNDSQNNQLFLCTGVVSFDLEDLFRNENLINIYNMNQLTLFAQLKSTTKSGAVYDDVSPTSPPR